MVVCVCVYSRLPIVNVHQFAVMFSIAVCLIMMPVSVTYCIRVCVYVCEPSDRVLFFVCGLHTIFFQLYPLKSQRRLYR